MEGRQALRLARKAANEAGKAGRLLEFRSELLCERELLCRAVRWNDRRAVCELTRRGVTTLRAVNFAIYYDQPSLLAILLTLAPPLAGPFRNSNSLLERAMGSPGRLECVRLLIANGARLEKGRPIHFALHREAEAYEQRVRACRRAVAGLWTLKKRLAGEQWRYLDRYMFREIALAVWATRTEGGWSK